MFSLLFNKLLPRIWSHEFKYVLREIKKNSSDQPLSVVRGELDFSWVEKCKLLWFSYLHWRGLPFDYIFKNRSFLGEYFYIDRSVLIPRVETEELTEIILRHLIEKMTCFERTGRSVFRILDIGTGSGVIAISLTKRLASYPIEVWGIDCSSQAIIVAKKNQQKILADSVGKARLQFLVADVFSPKIDRMFCLTPFDLIVSNPPYIATGEKEKMEVSVLKYEPGIALWGGVTGLEFYQRLAPLLSNWLVEDGEIFLELGLEQAADVKRFFSYLKRMKIIKDLCQKERFFYGKDLRIS